MTQQKPALPPEVPVAESTELVDLPGLFRKSIVIGAGEVGLVVNRGQVTRTLPPGKQHVGWVLFGSGVGKSAVRITQEFSARLAFHRLPTRDYKTVDASGSLRLRVEDAALFYRAFLRDKSRAEAQEVSVGLASALDDFVQARVMAANGLALTEGKGAEEVAAALEPVAADYLKARGLRLATPPTLAFRIVVEEDKAAEEIEAMRARFTTETLVERAAQEAAVKALEQQGLITTEELVNVRLAIGTGSPEAPRMIAELLKRADKRQETNLAVRGQALTEKVAAAAGAPAPAAAAPPRRRILPFLPLIGVLLALGAYLAWFSLVGPKVENALKGMGGTGALVGVMLMDSRIFVRSYIFKLIFWLGGFFGGFVLGRKTAPKAAPAATAPAPASAPAPAPAPAVTHALATSRYQGGPDAFLGFIVMAIAVGFAPGALVYVILRYGAEQRDLALALGIVVGVIGVFFAGLYELSRLQAWRRAQQDTGPKLDKWVERHSLQTDELIRRQIGRDLSTYLNDLKETKLQAHRKDLKEVTARLDGMEKEADLFRTEVEGAAYGRTVLTAKGKPARARVARLIGFEEDLSRNARALALGAQEVREGFRKGADISAQAEGLTVTLQALRRRFSQRQSFLEGFIQ